MKIPYGFSQDKMQKISINQEQANAIKQIYDLYLQGKSLGSIVQELEQLSITSPTGNKTWSRAAIDKILSNKKYINTIIPFEKYVEAQLEKDSRSNMQSNNTRKTARYNSQNVLSGLLVCGECGNSFRRIKRTNGEVVWRCADKVENGRSAKCENSITIDDLELKKHLCSELEMLEYDEQRVADTIESIIVSENGFDINLKQQPECSISF